MNKKKKETLDTIIHTFKSARTYIVKHNLRIQFNLDFISESIKCLEKIKKDQNVKIKR